MISPTSRRRTATSGDQRCSRVAVANTSRPTTRSSASIGASAPETTPFRARLSRSRAASGGSSSSRVRVTISRASNTRLTSQGNASSESDAGGPPVPARTHWWVRITVRSRGTRWTMLARSTPSSSPRVPSVWTIWASMVSAGTRIRLAASPAMTWSSAMPRRNAWSACARASALPTSSATRSSWPITSGGQDLSSRTVPSMSQPTGTPPMTSGRLAIDRIPARSRKARSRAASTGRSSGLTTQTGVPSARRSVIHGRPASGSNASSGAHPGRVHR